MSLFTLDAFWEWSLDFLKDPVAVFTAIVAVGTFLLWRATRALVKSSERTTERQLRAYVGVEQLAFESGDARARVPEEPEVGYIHRNFVVATIRNFGQTPAFNVTVFVYVSIQAFGARLADDFFEVDRPDLPSVDNVRTTLARYTLNRNQTEVSKTTLQKPVAKSVRDARAKKCSIYVYGRIYYKDAFDRPWRTKFCYAWEPWHPQGERFVPYEEHNGEDQKEIGE